MTWGAWEDSDRPGMNVYAEWDRVLEGSESATKGQVVGDPQDGNPFASFDTINFASAALSAFIFDPQAFTQVPQHQFQSIDSGSLSTDNGSAGSVWAIDKDTREEYGKITVPKFMSNKGPYETFLKSQGSQVPDDLPALPLDTVIVGVVDTGIALGHRATRLADGTTRIVAAWQQSADILELPDPPEDKDDRDPNLEYKQAYLPYGREYYADDIDAALEMHSIGGIRDGWLDEDAFNLELDLVDFVNPRGHRALSMRHAHGTHVLARAAGYDSVEEPEMSEKTRIIAVNLPSREVVGLSGTYLEQYVVAGIARIVTLADAFWQKTLLHEAETGGENGKPMTELQLAELLKKPSFPIVINFSFGKQAGPKDGTGPIAALLGRLNAEREKSKDRLGIELREAFLISPSGNDNLTRSNALIEVTCDDTDKDGHVLALRILPEDQSSNYLEIWTDPIDGTIAKGADLPLQVSVSVPGDDSTRYFTPAKNRQVRMVGNSAHLYADVFPHFDEKKRKHTYRIRYTLCTAPTLLQDQENPELAPAGLWQIRLRQTLGTPIKVTCQVQADQSILPSGATGRRAYFDMEGYDRHDETTGRAIDTFSYTYDEANPIDLDPTHGVRRHGTLNSAGIYSEFTVVTGGHRATDGKPADYASTGRAEYKIENGEKKIDGVKHHKGLAAPTLSLVTDDGAAYPGILSSGARDGSTVAMQGTSFAASQFTRLFSNQLLDYPNLNPKAFAQMVQEGKHPTVKPETYPGKTNLGKTGRDRLAVQNYRNLSRRGAVDD